MTGRIWTILLLCFGLLLPSTGCDRLKDAATGKYESGEAGDSGGKKRGKKNRRAKRGKKGKRKKGYSRRRGKRRGWARK